MNGAQKHSVDGTQRGDHPVQGPGGHVLGHLELASGRRSGTSLQQYNVPWNSATGHKGTHW